MIFAVFDVSLNNCLNSYKTSKFFCINFDQELSTFKGYSSRRLKGEFPQKGCNKNSLDALLHNINVKKTSVEV